MKHKQTKAKKRRPNNTPPKTWNLSEILYAFTGFLTTRGHPLIFSARHDAAPIAEMVGRFIDANGLPLPRNNWNVLKSNIPPGTDHLTNERKTDTYLAAPRMTAERALNVMMDAVNQLGTDQEDITVAAFLDQLKVKRRTRLDVTRHKERETSHQAETAQNAFWNIEKIARGDYAVLYPVKNLEQ